jgi:hypothetical protein
MVIEIHHHVGVDVGTLGGFTHRQPSNASLRNQFALSLQV